MLHQHIFHAGKQRGEGVSCSRFSGLVSHWGFLFGEKIYTVHYYDYYLFIYLHIYGSDPMQSVQKFGRSEVKPVKSVRLSVCLLFSIF